MGNGGKWGGVAWRGEMDNTWFLLLTATYVIFVFFSSVSIQTNNELMAKTLSRVSYRM